MINKEVKQRIISDLRVHETDTGSPEVQVALLTERINHLSGHLKEHKKTILLAGDCFKWLDTGQHCLNIYQVAIMIDTKNLSINLVYGSKSKYLGGSYRPIPNV